MAELENKEVVLNDDMSSNKEVTTTAPSVNENEGSTIDPTDPKEENGDGSVSEDTEPVVEYFYYLKRDSGFTELTFKLDENYITGSTYEDYLLNKWVLLSDEQLDFRDKHPGATPREIINMIEPPTPPEPSISDIKSRKISEVTQYDLSPNINSFYLNGMQVWLDKDTRVGLMNSINIEKAAGRSETVLWLNNINLTINCDMAIKMLSALELYALACYNKTAEHKNTISNLETIQEVNDYDYTIGYPEKLNLSTTEGILVE